MKIDITNKLKRKKYSVFKNTTVYINNKYYAFVSKLGIGFLKRNKNGVRLTANNRVKWYHSSSNDLRSALTSVRKNYGITIPSKEWKKIKVKHYNLSDIKEIVNAL